MRNTPRTPPNEPPVRLPDLPVKAEKLLGISSEGFYSAVPIIHLVDGQIYSYDWQGQDYAWRSSDTPEETRGDPCGEEEIRQIEAASGKILDCRTVGTSGEYCPGPIVSFAITSNTEITTPPEQNQAKLPKESLSSWLVMPRYWLAALLPIPGIVAGFIPGIVSGIPYFSLLLACLFVIVISFVNTSLQVIQHMTSSMTVVEVCQAVGIR